jgi:hypothetical protein
MEFPAQSGSEPRICETAIIISVLDKEQNTGTQLPQFVRKEYSLREMWCSDFGMI